MPALYRSAVILSPSPSATVESTSMHRDTGWIIALSLAVGVTAVVLLVAAAWWFRFRKRGGETPPPPPPLPPGEKVPWLYRVPVLAALSYSTRSLTSFSAPRHPTNASVTTLSTIATTEEDGAGGRGKGYDQGAVASRRRSESFVTLEMGRPGVAVVDTAVEKK